MLLSKLLCVVFSLAMLLQAHALRRAVGTWIYPACLYGLFWFAFTLFPVVLVPGTYSSPYAVGYILASCIAVSLGGTFINFAPRYAAAPSFEEQDRRAFSSPLVQLIFAVSVISALVCLVIDAAFQGISLAALMSDFFAASNSFLAARYSDDLIANIFSQLATVLNYLASFLGGLIYWAISNRPERWRKAAVIVMTFVPSIFVLTVQAAKGTIFLSLALFVAGILLCRARAKQDLPINWSTFRIGVRYALILLPFLIVSFVSRGLYEARSLDDAIFTLRRNFTSYALGHLYAFSDWFDYTIMMKRGVEYYTVEDVSYGFYTFMSVFRALGDDRFVPAGVFEEYYDDGEFVATNIFTAFRALITDFTLIGSLIFTILVSSIIHLSFKNAVAREKSPISMSVFVIFCGYLASSYIISVLIWNSVYALFFAIAGFLVVAHSAHGVRRRAGI